MSQADFEDLFDNAPVGYVTLSPDGHIEQVNQTLSAWLQMSPTSLIGRRFTDLLSIGGRVFFETHLRPLLKLEGSLTEVALDLIDANGARLLVLANANERYDDAGRVQYARFALFKATERRKYERGLLAARTAALASLGAEREVSELREQFIAVLGHDLRNPLASITGASRLLSRESLSERGRTILQLMDGSALRMAGLIDNVLDFARGRLGGGFALERRPTELPPVLEQVVQELLAAHPGLRIETDYAVTCPIDCDGSRVAQLVSNLLSNAMTHGAESAPVRLTARVIDDHLEIAVANRGDPIPEAAMARLFQPFFRGEVRSSQQGLGLGLHIATEIAKAHGGELAVASSIEETRFTLRMPIAAP